MGKTVYDNKTRNEILRRIASGESLRSVCRNDSMPSTGLVRKWALKDMEGFGKQYALARTECAYARLDKAFDRIEEIPTYIDESGNQRLDPAGVNQARLYCDMAKWEASKLIPEYNDRLNLEHSMSREPLSPADATEAMIKAAVEAGIMGPNGEDAG